MIALPDANSPPRSLYADDASAAAQPAHRSETADGCILNAGEVGLEAAAPQRAAAADLVSDDELVLLILRPSLLYIPLGSLVALILIALLTFFLAYLSRVPWAAWTDTTAFAFGFVAAGLRLGWQSLEWYSRLYILTDRRLIRRKGVLRVSVFETPLKNIQHTTVLASVRERVFNLGSIGFATSGSEVFDAFWEMVRQPFVVHRTVVKAIRRYGSR